MLHRLIYVAAIAGVVHYWWLVKADIRHPEAYAVVVGALFAFRILWAMRDRASLPVRPARGQASPSPASID
jgi:methionine sulfoxide reductase heme-binding subunit